MVTKKVVGIYALNEPELFNKVVHLTQKEFPWYTVQIDWRENFLKIDHTKKKITVWWSTMHVDVMFNVISLNETALATVERYLSTILSWYTYDAKQLLQWIADKIWVGANIIFDEPATTEDVKDNSLIDNSLIDEINARYWIDIVKTYLDSWWDSRYINIQSTQEINTWYYELTDNDKESYMTNKDILFVDKWWRGNCIAFYRSYIMIWPYKFSRKHLKPITYRWWGMYMNLEKESWQSVYYYPDLVYEEICYCEWVLPITREIVEEIVNFYVNNYSMLLALLGINNWHYANDTHYTSNALKLDNNYIMNESWIITIGSSVMCEALFIYP